MKKNQEQVNIFSDYLFQNKSVIKYLLERGVTQDLIDKKMIGYCPSFYSYWWDMLRGRIIVPIYDSYGELLSFAGRIYQPMEKVTLDFLKNNNNEIDGFKKIEMWKRGKWLHEPYSKTSHVFLLNEVKEEAYKRKYIILTEGYFDSLTIWGMSKHPSGSISGTKISDRQCVLISRYVDDVILMLDGDEAGEMSLKFNVNKLKQYGLNPHVVKQPNGYDPDTLLLEHGSKLFDSIVEKTLSNNLEILNLKK